MTHDDPAFPYQHAETRGGAVSTESATGLTKRELFAAMAMQGLLAGEYRSATPEQATIVAFHAREQADALLAALQTE